MLWAGRPTSMMGATKKGSDKEVCPQTKAGNARNTSHREADRVCHAGLTLNMHLLGGLGELLTSKPPANMGDRIRCCNSLNGFSHPEHCLRQCQEVFGKKFPFEFEMGKMKILHTNAVVSWFLPRAPTPLCPTSPPFVDGTGSLGESRKRTLCFDISKLGPFIHVGFAAAPLRRDMRGVHGGRSASFSPGIQGLRRRLCPQVRILLHTHCHPPLPSGFGKQSLPGEAGRESGLKDDGYISFSGGQSQPQAPNPNSQTPDPIP